ncbi:MAG: SPFH domain-containing protein [Selenomonadaceae bacterium]|nr:SPFH domain-containing protein [Selenomonadaceae bacterium]
MGLIKAALGAVGGVLADQWKENFYCDALTSDVLVAKGQRQQSLHGRSSNTSGENIITNGSTIVVNNGQCAIIVDQGKVAELAAEPGQYTYDQGSEPSIFTNGAGLSEKIALVFEQIGRRFAYGGAPGKDQRIYYFNVKEITGNKYGTPSPIPFRVVDTNIGLDVDISIRCFGTYSYKIVNPILFYTNVCGNVTDVYDRSQIDAQLKSELQTALQPAFAQLSGMGIRYSALPAHTMEIADALNQVLSKKWGELRGIEVVSFGVSNVNASEEDEKMIKDLQRNATFRDPSMAAAQLVGAQATAMNSAASNPNGAAMGFFGMNMAAQAGGFNAQNLFAMGQAGRQQAQQQATAPRGSDEGWTCSKGHAGNRGKFCAECGEPKPAPAGEWVCECGTKNTGKFCAECGKPKPAEGWTCAECGHEGNKGKFCAECGKPRA